MDTVTDWSASVSASLGEALGAVAGMLPRALAAVVVLLLGWLLARLLRRATGRGLAALDRLLGRFPQSAATEIQRVRRSTVYLTSALVFWAVFFVFLAMAASVLRLPVVSRSLESMVGYLPTFAAGLVVIIVGVLLGGVIHTVVLQASQAAGLRHANLLGRAAQVAVILTAGVIGTAQLGIDVTLLANLVTVIVAALAGGFALSLALGMPGQIQNLISVRDARSRYALGDLIRIGGYEGRVLEFSGGHVILETREGEVAVPARLFGSEACLRLAEGESRESEPGTGD